MKAFDEIIQKNLRWLEQKGYRESRLNMFSQPDNYKRNLEEELALCSVSTVQGDTGSSIFKNAMTAFMRNGKDIVSYDFQYRYTPEYQELKPERLTASLNFSTLTFFLGKMPYDLPDQSKVYSLLQESIQYVLSPSQQAIQLFLDTQKPTVDKVMRVWIAERARLVDSGYPFSQNDSPEMPGKLTRRVAHQIREILATRHFYRDKMPYVTVPGNIHHPESSMPVQLLFLYAFDPWDLMLNLRALRAGMGSLERRFVMRTSTDLPHADVVLDKLATDRIIKMAKEFAEREQCKKLVSKQHL